MHWRSTARHDELMVRLEERPWRGGTTVLLDRRDAAHRGHGPAASLEFAISLAASIGVHLIGRGDPVHAGHRGRGRAHRAGPDRRRRRAAGRAGRAASLRPARADRAGAASGDRPDRRAGRARAGRAGRAAGAAGRRARGAAGHGDLGATRRAGPGDAGADTGGTRSGHRDRRPSRDNGRGPTERGAPASDQVAGPAATLRRAGWQVVVATAGAAPADRLGRADPDRPGRGAAMITCTAPGFGRPGPGPTAGPDRPERALPWVTASAAGVAVLLAGAPVQVGRARRRVARIRGGRGGRRGAERAAAAPPGGAAGRRRPVRRRAAPAHRAVHRRRRAGRAARTGAARPGSAS